MSQTCHVCGTTLEVETFCPRCREGYHGQMLPPVVGQVFILVDCEGVDALHGTCREFGAVELRSRASFHGKDCSAETFRAFEAWLGRFHGRPVFVSDNPAYDWQAINYGFLKHVGQNPFGYTARRIGDFFAGLTGNWYDSSSWKKYRQTPHTHNPVDDAMGNAEALAELLGRGSAGRVEQYDHHGRMVYVRSDLKGRHREFCLCFQCDNFYPDDALQNCPVARVVFNLCRRRGLVLPVWECGWFVGSTA